MKTGCSVGYTPPACCEFTPHFENAVAASVRRGAGFFLDRESALGEQQAPQHSEIVQYPPACRDVQIEFGEIIRNQKEAFLAALRSLSLSGRNLFLDIAPGFA